MLLSLSIQNLILVRSAKIDFEPGLTILTGETGSGKSALLLALELIAGERADTQWIRKGAPFAVVEASLTPLPLPCFSDGTLSPPPPGEPLLVRRELHRSGKSRCFLAEQQVPLSLLKTQLAPLFDFIGPTSSHALRSRAEQLALLDTFASLSLERWSELYREQKEGQERLSHLRSLPKDLKLKAAEQDLAHLEKVNWQPGEEGPLLEEHHLLSHAQELLEEVGGAAAALSDGEPPLLATLKRVAGQLEKSGALDPTLKSLAEGLKRGLCELEEVSYALTSYLDRLSFRPDRLAWVEGRIGEIEGLKRRFGKTWEEVEKKKKEIASEVEELLQLDEEIQALQEGLETRERELQQVAQEITAQRRHAGELLGSRVQTLLPSLNLPHAKMAIELHPKERSLAGEDEVRFLFSANLGVPPIPLEECASSGELSRLLFALKTIVAEKEKSLCLVFDEIDSNVGGQTAAVLGEKLAELAKGRQVLCVTHFVQVAKRAAHHFAVEKREVEGEMVTQIAKLNPRRREEEYQRMVGGHSEGRTFEGLR